MNASKHAYTLIELLIVIAIIAILTAILLPVFVQILGDGRRVNCTSNMRQLSYGLSAYRDDYEGKDPGAARPGEYCHGALSGETYLIGWQVSKQ